MISRRKNIEVRILKEKSEAIQVGDIITFNNQGEDLLNKININLTKFTSL